MTACETRGCERPARWWRYRLSGQGVVELRCEACRRGLEYGEEFRRLDKRREVEA